MSVSGIRPDFIRMSEVFSKLDQEFEHTLVHTGQHYDPKLSEIFFKDLEIRNPDFNLGIGAPGKKHYEQQAELSVKLIELCDQVKPDLVLFLGDSNSVLASIPLKKEGYKIGHIEAGMRSYDMRMLEEINRKACDHVSDFLFVYHKNYKEKAIRENIDPEKIFVVGNTIVEPLQLIADFSYHGVKSHIILDIHRPENFKYKERLQNIITLAKRLSERWEKPVKMLDFSRTMQYIKEFDIALDGIDVIPLMGYKDFIKFQQDSRFIISDSGTAQEEPALLNIPVVVPRDFTERPESIDAGNSCLIAVDDVNMDEVFTETIAWLSDAFLFGTGDTSWLGDGTTSQKIVDILKEKLLA